VQLVAALGQRPAAVVTAPKRFALPDVEVALQHRVPSLHARTKVAMSALLCCWVLHRHMRRLPQRPATGALKLLLVVVADVPLEAVVDLPCFGVDCLGVGEHLRDQLAFDQLLAYPLNAKRTRKRERQWRQAAGTALSLVTCHRKCVRAVRRDPQATV